MRSVLKNILLDRSIAGTAAAAGSMAFEGDLNLEARELRLGPPGMVDQEKGTSPGSATKKKRRSPELPSCDGGSNLTCDDSRKCNRGETARLAKKACVGSSRTVPHT